MKNNKTFYTDVFIIGAGPVGLFAIFQCGMHSLKCHIIDSLPEIGGQCMAMYPHKPIYDIPAHSSILAKDLILELQKQAEVFSPYFHLNQTAIGLEELHNFKDEKKENYNWLIKTSEENKIYAKTIIIAGGVGSFSPKKLPLDNAYIYEGESIFYNVNDINKFTDKKIMIVGGGDSAFDWAIHLFNKAKKIFFVHRRDKFRAHSASIDTLYNLSKQKDKLEILTGYQISQLHGNKSQLNYVDIKNFAGKVLNLEIDILLPFFGLSSNLGPISKWGLNTYSKTININPATCKTNIPGIFAIGDIAHYENRQKLIVHGFSEAAKAAFSAREFIFPDQTFHFEHSSTSGINKI